MIFELVLAQVATDDSNKTAVIIVAVIGAFSTIVGVYLTYRGSKKQTEVTSESQERGSVLKEREQLSDEWKALREYQSVQLTAARKEIEGLEGQIRTMKSALTDRDVLLDEANDKIYSLGHTAEKLERDNASQKRQLDFPPADK